MRLIGTNLIFFVYFRLFKHPNFKTIICEKRQSSIRCWDSNPRPSDHESPPITTRPGLPPYCSLSCMHSLKSTKSMKTFVETLRSEFFFTIIFQNQTNTKYKRADWWSITGKLMQVGRRIFETLFPGLLWHETGLSDCCLLNECLFLQSLIV